MSKHTPLQSRIYEELAKFQKTSAELTLLRTVSKDLRNFKKMLSHKNND